MSSLNEEINVIPRVSLDSLQTTLFTSSLKIQRDKERLMRRIAALLLITFAVTAVSPPVHAWPLFGPSSFAPFEALWDLGQWLFGAVEKTGSSIDPWGNELTVEGPGDVTRTSAGSGQ